MSSPGFQVPDSSPEVVLFDAGGTLVLIDPDRFNAFIARWDLPEVSGDRLIRAHFQAMSDYASRLRAGEPLQFRWWVERYFELIGIALTVEMVRAFGGGRGMWNHPIPGARETVEAVRAKALRVGVVSNSDGSVAEALDIAGFGGLFEVVIDSTNVGISKPDPAIFKAALDALGVPADQTWYVGDSHHHDIDGAHAAGLAAAVLIDPLGLAPEGQLSVRSITELSELLA